MPLFHFSDNASIEVFVPRPVRKPAIRPNGMEWLNGPLVWAIEEQFAFMYLFPRDCPRILVWATDETTSEDQAHWLGTSGAVAYVEELRLPELAETTVYRYSLPEASFVSLDDAGMWVSDQAVVPMQMDPMSNLPSLIESMGVELRVVQNLLPFRSLWDSSLHVSGIRLRNAVGWTRSGESS